MVKLKRIVLTEKPVEHLIHFTLHVKQIKCCYFLIFVFLCSLQNISSSVFIHVMVEIYRKYIIYEGKSFQQGAPTFIFIG